MSNILSFLHQKELDSLYNQYIINESRREVLSKPNISDIQKSIKLRNYVGIYYEDIDDKGKVLSGFRLIEPLVLGNGYKSNTNSVSKNDKMYLRAYVIKDTQKEPNFNKSSFNRKSVSKSKRVPYYRLLRVDKISSWYDFPKKFSKYRELYNPDDKNINNILTALQFSDFPKGETKLHLNRNLRNKLNKLR